MQVQSWLESQQVVRSALHRTVQAARPDAAGGGPSCAPPRALPPVTPAVPRRVLAAAAQMPEPPFAPAAVMLAGPPGPAALVPIAGGQEDWGGDARPLGALMALLARMLRREVTLLCGGQQVTGKLIELDPITLSQPGGRVAVVELPFIQGIFF